MTNRWTYATSSGYSRTSRLGLVWEMHCDPISDDYTPDEITAEELLRRWIDRYTPDESAERLYGPGMVGISWFVDSLDDGTFESAPFAAAAFGNYHEDFLTTYSWPRHADTGELLNWLTLPIRDKLWNSEHGDKGGFIQQATGWKPSPLQPAVHLSGLLAAVPGLAGLLPYEPRILT